MSLCQIPAFNFSFGFALPIPSLPSIPSFTFTLLVPMPSCPLD